MTSPGPNSCTRCGAPLRHPDSESLCTRCLLEQGLSEPPEEAEAQDPGKREPPASEADRRGANLDQGSIRQFGDYDLLEEIARGGMGVVYRARQRRLDRVVAVKMILAGQFASPQVIQRFRGEVTAAALLQHPNIVAIHDVGLHDGQHYFSMDYVAGQNLSQLVGNRPLPPAKAARYVQIVAEAIQYAHQQGILHRDLKPANVLVDANDQPRITDFGLAKRLDGDASITLTGQMLGSPNFMPPEQASARFGKVGRPSDVYGLGAILYYLLTARPPFQAASFESVVEQVLATEPFSPRLLNPSVPRDLETICLKCLEKEPSTRYRTAQELADELSRFLRNGPIQARPVSQLEKAWRWCLREPALASLGAAAALLLLAIFIGSPIAIYRIQQARKAEQVQLTRAESEARKSGEVARFLKDMISSIGPFHTQGRDSAEVFREMLENAEARLDRDLTPHPEVQAELYDAIGVAYGELYDYGRSEALIRKALELRRTRQAEDDPEMMNTMFHLVSAIWHQRERRPDFAPLLQQSFALHVKVNGSNNVRTAEFLNLCSFQEETSAQGEILSRRALAILSTLGATNNLVFGTTLAHIGHHLLYQDRLDEAIAFGRQALTSIRQVGGDRHPWALHARYELAVALRSNHQLAECEDQARACWEGKRFLFGATNEVALDSLWLLASTTFERGDLAGADALLVQAPLEAIPTAWAGRTVAGEEERFWLIRTLTGLVWSQRSASNLTGARRYARCATALAAPLVLMRQASPAADAWRLANAHSVRGGALVATAATDEDIRAGVCGAKLEAAEAELLEGYAGLQQRYGTAASPTAHSGFLREATQRLVQLYEIWATLAPDPRLTDRVATWRGKLSALHATVPEP